MKKSTIIEQKEREIKALRKEIKNMENLETGRVYSFDYKRFGGEPYYTSLGIIETFNLESLRVRILSSDFEGFQDNDGGRYRKNIASIFYDTDMTPVTRTELPLHIGRKYVSSELHLLISGKKRMKGEKKNG